MRLLYIVTKIKLWHNILYLPIDFMNKMWYHIKAPTRYAKRKIGTALQGVVLPVLTGFLKCATAASASSSLCLLRRGFVDLHQGFLQSGEKRRPFIAFAFYWVLKSLLSWSLRRCAKNAYIFIGSAQTEGQMSPISPGRFSLPFLPKKQADPAAIFAKFLLESPRGIWMFGVFNITC